MKNSKKFVMVILPIVIIGILFLVSFQPEIEQLNTSLEENFALINTSSERKFGTINISSGSPMVGSSDAPVTIMAFGDYQCIGCKSWFLNTYPNIVENLIETEKANLVFVNAEILGNDSSIAAQAAYCANEQGKYWEYHNILYNSQQGIDDGWASSERLKEFAVNLELDMTLFESCLDSRKYEKKIMFNAYEAKKNGISKTPTFILVNSDGRHHIIKGVASYSVFEKIVDLFSQ